MRKKNTTIRIIVLILFCILITTSMTQALIKTHTYDNKNYENIVHNLNLLSTNKWEDPFNNNSKIDPSPPGVGLSDNYVVGNGVVSMMYTYPAWTNPSWTKMRQINITNTAGSILINYLIRLNITRYTGMQTNYNDIRFKRNGDTNWLNYYIEDTTENPAKVWVKMPSLPIGVSTFYLFYGNPAAVSASNISIFSSWEKRWTTDLKISNKLTTEGAWDPDVAYGKYSNQNRFLVGWEEGAGLPFIKQSILGKIFDSSGTVIVPQFFIHQGSGLTYRNENPSISYGANKFFVPYEHFTTPSDEDSRDVYGRYVDPTGSVTDCFVISDATHRQDDPVTTFNTINNEFFVTWFDGRANVPPDTWNYNVYAKRYDASGNQIGAEITICSDVKNQMDPWVAYDDVHNRYMVVFEEGDHPHDGPFSIYARVFDHTGTPMSGKILIVSGSTNMDNIYPCVAFCRQTQRYLITWNTADMMNDNWYGTVKGKILDGNGTTVKDVFTIDNVHQFVRTDIVSYGGSTFFIAYNNLETTSYNSDIWGKLMTSSGSILTPTAIRLSDANSAAADWVNLAVDDTGTIFTVWEDARDNTAAKPDVYANNWWLRITGTTVSYTIGSEKPLVLSAHVTSVQIIPTTMNKWGFFNASYTDGTITFDILDGATGSLLLQNVLPGANLYTQGIVASTIRLKASYNRTNPSTTPKLDKWSVDWEVNEPPTTPYNPHPANSSTGISVNTSLTWSGGDPNNDPVSYDVYFGLINPPGKILGNQSGTVFNPGIMSYNTLYYWRIVAWDTHGMFTTGPLWQFTTENRAPYLPRTPNPPDHATGVNVITTLSWIGGDPDSDPVTYDVYFGTTGSPPKVANNHSTTMYTLSLLNYGTTYYWKIISWDNHGASTVGPLWNFTTDALPYPPSNPTPAHHATNVSIYADLSWTGGDPDLGDAVFFDVYFGTSSSPPKVSANQSATLYQPATMNYFTTYHWRIVSWDIHGASSVGPLWEFTTTYIPNHPPFIPSNPIPENHTTNVGISIHLNWTGGDPDPGDTVTYDVYFGTSNPPPLIALAVPSASFDPGTLNNSRTYYWKIITWDNRGASTSGPVWDFSTEAAVNHPPYLPSDPTPSNHANDVYVLTDLAWNGGDPDPGDTVTYDVYFGIANPPPKVIGNQSSTTYDPGTMNYLTTYHWRIVAWDAHEASIQSSLWDFTTAAEVNNPPYTPTNPSPDNGSTSVELTPLLTWVGGDPDPGDTVTYDVFFGTTNPPLKISSNQSSTTYQSTPLEYNTIYYWKIISWDAHGVYTSGPLWHFATRLNTPPYEPNNPVPPNQAVNVSVNADLQWTGGDPDNDFVTYDVYFGTTSPPQKVAQNQTQPLYIPGLLASNTTYYWQIISWDGHHATTSGPIWSFTTLLVIDTIPPVVKILKPEKALYFRNTKLVAFFTPVVISAIDIEVSASDNESGVAKVEFYIDEQYKANTTTAPYTWTWTDKGFFIYMLKVVAYDNVGHSASTEMRVWKFF
jgi:hypothetical protein